LLQQETWNKRIFLTSNNSRCADFVTDGYCSTPLTNADLQWMEKVADCKPGMLFKRFSEAVSEPSSRTELPWDPMKRFRHLSAGGVLHKPRGSKSTEHLANLRKSDPLINLAAWHDWKALHQLAANSRAAKIHKQALVDRAQRAHARLKAGPGTTAPWVPPGEKLSNNKIRRAMFFVPSLQSMDEYGRGERASNDSVMAFELGYSDVSDSRTAAQKNANAHALSTDPMENMYLPPQHNAKVAKYDFDGGDAKLCAMINEDGGEVRSPTSVMNSATGIYHRGDQTEEKAFPPLPSRWDNGKAVDHALHEYKVVTGPAWYSDA